jgi:hypothetical protein
MKFNSSHTLSYNFLFKNQPLKYKVRLPTWIQTSSTPHHDGSCKAPGCLFQFYNQNFLNQWFNQSVRSLNCWFSHLVNNQPKIPKPSISLSLIEKWLLKLWNSDKRRRIKRYIISVLRLMLIWYKKLGLNIIFVPVSLRFFGFSPCIFFSCEFIPVC